MGPTGEGFESFFREEYISVVRTLVPILGDQADAEAVAQEAFVKAMARWRRLQSYDRPGAWVRRVAIRDAVRAAERRQRHQPLSDSRGVPMQDVPEMVDLDVGLAGLSPKQRASVVLHHLAGWPVAEVAEALGCAEATVRVHLHRGRAALAEALHENTEEVSDGSG